MSTIGLFSADFSQIKGTDLHRAIVDFTRVDLAPDDRTPEGYTVDFKEKWGDSSLRVIAAFANTFGGIVIVGVSEENGKAKEIVGEDSKSELTTRFAGSIAANITPTPSYDIAECELPSDKNKRLCVIRIRPADRIHFLTTKGVTNPVYIRNGDQAIPAGAAELRSLIARERNTSVSEAATRQASDSIFDLMPLYKPRPTNQALSAAQQYIPADSVLKIAIVPQQRERITLDYNVENSFRETVLKTFPKDIFAEDREWSSDEAYARTNSYFRIDYVHVSRSLETKWLVTNTRDFGFATLFALAFPPGSRVWSLPDIAAEMIASVRAAHSTMRRTGYLGEAQITVSIKPGPAPMVPLVERNIMPLLRHTGIVSNPWSVLIQAKPEQLDQSILATADSTFHTRTEEIASLVADLLNQVLRDMHYAANINELRVHCASLANVLPAPA